MSLIAALILSLPKDRVSMTVMPVNVISTGDILQARGSDLLSGLAELKPGSFGFNPNLTLDEAGRLAFLDRPEPRSSFTGFDDLRNRLDVVEILRDRMDGQYGKDALAEVIAGLGYERQHQEAPLKYEFKSGGATLAYNVGIDYQIKASWEKSSLRDSPVLPASGSQGAPRNDDSFKIAEPMIYFAPTTMGASSMPTLFPRSQQDQEKDTASLYTMLNSFPLEAGIKSSITKTFLMNPLFEGSSMNGLDLKRWDPMAINGLPEGFMALPTGTYMHPCGEPDYQPMFLSQPFWFRFGQDFGIEASTLMQQSPTGFRTLCGKMDKKEPAPGVKYLPMAAPRPIFRALLKLTEKSSFKGPWDQARLWIYTDKASLAEINERLLPPVPPGRYITGLFDVHRFGGFKEEDYKNRKLFSLDLAAAPCTDANAHVWLIHHMAKNWPNEVARLYGQGSEEVEALFDEKAAEYVAESAARTVRQIFLEKDPNVRAAMRKHLQTRVSDAMKAKLMKLNAFTTLYLCLFDCDEAEAKDVLATLRSCGVEESLLPKWPGSTAQRSAKS